MTEYTLAEESSIAAAFSGAELLGVSQASVFKKATVLDLMIAGQAQTFASASFAGTNTFPANSVAQFNGNVLISNSGFSTLIAVTKSGKVGFWGHAGTSQRAGAVQASMTLSGFTAQGSATVGFTSTAAASLLWGQVAEIRQTLVDLGVWKGS